MQKYERLNGLVPGSVIRGTSLAHHYVFSHAETVEKDLGHQIIFSIIKLVQGDGKNPPFFHDLVYQ